MSNLIKYRPEIDGLRTIAVLSVILYHANFQIFGQNPIKGGFLGVDIFFVISGYLITSILLTGFREKSLTLLNFYERRIRRILPILLFVMTVSMPFSWMLLLPSDFQSYSYQLLSSIFSVSNFYFWSEDSYWAAESILKPFLHTWSLGVEEQFYLFMPLLVMCFSYKNISRPTFVLLAIALVSLVSSHFMSISDSQSSFYLFPFRSWELLIGASIATYREQQFSDEVFVEKVPYLPSIGLLIIFLSFYFFSESTLHPSFYTLLPTLGVALVILFSNEKDFSIKLLRNKVMNFIGLISYGLYLWHFPIFSYLSHANLFEDSLIKIGAIVLIFVLSIVTYFIIEKPFRSFSSIKSKIFWCILVIWVLLLSMTAVIGMKDGFSFRVPELVNIPSDPENIENHKWFATEKNLRGRVVLVGDSHIGSIAPFFKTWAKDEGFDFAISEWSGCQLILNMNRVSKNDFHPLQNCNIKSQKMRLNFIENLKPSIVMMGGRLPLIIEETQRLKNPKKTVLSIK